MTAVPAVDLRGEILRCAAEDELLPMALLFRLPQRPAHFTNWWTELVGELQLARTTYAEDGTQAALDLQVTLHNITWLLREVGLDGDLEPWQVQ